MNKTHFLEDLRTKISRRDFIKFFGLASAGFLLPEKVVSNITSAQNYRGSQELLGRITQAGHPIHQKPNWDSDVIDEMPMDSLWRITGMAVSEDETSANRIWYELGKEGFTHSSRIQPVRKQINRVDTSIPEDGCLGEITMPFVDAYSSMNADRAIVYRFYYGSTFWILKRLTDDQGSVWYQLLDDRYYSVFYIPAYNMRLVPDTELTPISPNVDLEDKKIVVDLASQTMTAYEGEKEIFISRISSGVLLKEGGFATPKGYYRTTRKRPCRHMANPPNAYGTGFDLPGVPWVSYFTSDGVAFHGAYWHNDFGVAHSHGCINMTPQAAKWVYRWTTPWVPPENYYYSDKNGTRVIVQ